MIGAPLKLPIPVPQTAPDDPRVGHLLGQRLVAGDAPRVVIIGFPTDQGVRRNGGRPGATAAPMEIRRFLFRLAPDPEAGEAFIDLLGRALDLGDMPVSPDLEGDQDRLGEVVARALEQGAFPIILGGGHETAYGHFLGYVRTKRPICILNWDAHTDVRVTAEGQGHSGSPFRQALLHPSGLCRRYQVAGLLPNAIAGAHLRFIAERRGEAIWRRDLTASRVNKLYTAMREPTMVSFDIDAVDQAHAPGVSAPATGGMSTELWFRAAYGAGRSARVTSCDLCELCPIYDRDGQTARLAALTVWWVLKGLAERTKGGGIARVATSLARRKKRS